jgi:hypothetical protein
MQLQGSILHFKFCLAMSSEMLLCHLLKTGLSELDAEFQARPRMCVAANHPSQHRGRNRLHAVFQQDI